MLAHFKHPNVMGLIGVSTVLQPVLVIIPYMPNGDLKSYLKLKYVSLSGARLTQATCMI